MGALPPVVATFLADSKGYTAGVDKMIAKNQELGASTKTMGQHFSSFASKASTGILGVAAVGAIASVKLAGNFQLAMTQLVTGAGEAQKNIALVSKGILGMAGAVGQTPAELAKGMYLIESAGYHGAAALKVLKASAEGAAVGGADMAVVANAVTTGLHDYHLSASRANEMTSAFIETVARGKVHLTDLATSIGKSMPVAAALGISFQQVTGAIATMTNAGMSARFASTHLQNTLLALSAPSKVATIAMESIGLTSQGLKNILADPQKGLSAAIKTVSDAVGKTFPRNSVDATAAFKAIMGGTTGFATAMMLGGKNAAGFTANVRDIGAALNKTQPQVQGFALVQKDLNFQLASLKAAGTSALISVGQFLLPKATEVVKWVNQTTTYLKAHPIIGKGALDIGAALLGGAAATKLAGVGISIAEAFGLAIPGTIAAGIGAAVGLGILTFMVGKPGGSSFNKAHGEKNPILKGFDVFALTVNTFSSAVSKLIPYGRIPLLPVFGPNPVAVGARHSNNADLPRKVTVTVKGKLKR